MENNRSFEHVGQAIQWIHNLQTLGIKPGLKRMEYMMERLNHPERRLKFVHIGGTNGKGSTLTYMRNVLQEAGYDVGSFTSPYIIRFHNRIQINGIDIADEHLVQAANHIKPLAEELAHTDLGAPTEFEVVTAIAIYYFAHIAFPDIVLWEVGLGGRLDSTNIINPLVSVITNVGNDHMHILGDTIGEIAFEKAGIIKAGVPIVTGAKDDQALQIIRQKATNNRSSIYVLNEAFEADIEKYDEHEQLFKYTSKFFTYHSLSIIMKGKHQIENAAVAIMALELLKQYYAIIWDEEHLRAGLKVTQWVGRLETVNSEPTTILDGAHNPQGMDALAKAIKQYYTSKKIIVFFSAMKDKEVVSMLKTLDGLVDLIILADFDFPRAATADELFTMVQNSGEKWQSNIEKTDNYLIRYNEEVHKLKEQLHDVVIFFTGSLYFISDVRSQII